MRKSFKFLLFLALAAGAVYCYRYLKQTYFSHAPGPRESARLLMENVGVTDREVIRSLFLVENRKTGRRGTGLLASRGFILTDVGIAAGARPGDLIVYSTTGRKIRLDGFEVEPDIGVVVLRPSVALKGGMDLDGPSGTVPGQKVYTWGFPRGELPPSPLFCAGAVAGYRTVTTAGGVSTTRLVLSGPFTMGNAGGPLFRSEDYKLIGFVVTQRVPLDPFIARALKALRTAPPGATVDMEDESGRLETIGAGELSSEVFERLAADQAGVEAEAVPIGLLKQRLADMR